MKKYSTLALTLGITAIGGLVLAQTAYADDSKDTIAKVTVEAGALSLPTVDNIDFGSQTITGEDMELSNKDAKIVINDLRGSSSKGWTLTAKLKEGNFSGMGLKFNPQIITNDEVAVASETQHLNTDLQLVSSIADDKIVNTEFDTSVALGATLNIPAKTKANSYSTTVVWNLAETPETR